MTAFLRALPGLTALMMSLLSGYVWVYAGPYSPSLFALAHTVSAVLCVAVPFTFLLVGRATGCRADLLKLGAVLLGVAGVPMLIANGIYLFSFGSVEASYGDIGGIGLALLGMATLLITSVAGIIGLLVARPTISETPRNNRIDSRNRAAEY